MSLDLRTRLGPFEILAPLGMGGMGEVYRARDSKLGREVALKVLPQALAIDPERMARFQREAQVLASLNHPNIASIYGFEESGSVRALVMELVEGPTLADRIERGPIAVDDALPIAKQIAEALEAAHERGIIHRDLKPANIKIKPDSTAKVLDFGLAKAIEGDPTSTDIQNSPTLSGLATQAGIILGTAAYMSPEQAKGKSVDRRTDNWAFGVVLFEMLSGKRAFEGETVTDTLAAVVRGEPDWTRLPAATPPRIRGLLRRCLQKDPKQRLQAIGEARIAIEGTLNRQEGDDATLATGESSWRRVLLWAIAGTTVIVAGIALTAWWRESRPATDQPLVEFVLSTPPNEQLALADSPAVAISPDGTYIAYVVGRGTPSQIYVRALNQLDAKPVAGTERGINPFFSPDAHWMAFYSEGKLKKVPSTGGIAETLCDATGNTRGGSWGPDGNLYISPGTTGGLFRVPATGGTPQPFTSPDAAKGERTHRWPQALPDGKNVLFTVGSINSPEFYDDSEIDAASVATGRRKVLLKGAAMARYVPTGHLVYARGGELFAVPFDLGRMEVTGQAVRVLQNVSGDTASGAYHLSVSGQGTLIYVEGAPAGGQYMLAWEDEKGAIDPLPVPLRFYRDPALSPDGKRIAVGIIEGKTQDIWIYNIPDNTMSRLTFEAQNQRPIWTPDGKRVIFSSSIGDVELKRLFWKPADGSGAAEIIIEGSTSISWAISPDGKTLAFSQRTESTQTSGLWSISLDGDRKPMELFKTSGEDRAPAFSPDDRYITYTTIDGSIEAVYVQSYPPAGGRWQVSSGHGLEPQWSRDGKKLFYRDGANLMVVPVETKPTFKAGTPRAFLTNLFHAPGGFQDYVVSPDGRRVLVVRPSEKTTSSDRMVVIVNWFDELRRAAAERK
jgi:serine/threonine-protein kinase